ncbi:unnamed protein product, partial [Discosporangium mesarthrocarpum]
SKSDSETRPRGGSRAVQMTPTNGAGQGRGRGGGAGAVEVTTSTLYPAPQAHHRVRGVGGGEVTGLSEDPDFFPPIPLSEGEGEKEAAAAV